MFSSAHLLIQTAGSQIGGYYKEVFSCPESAFRRRPVQVSVLSQLKRLLFWAPFYFVQIPAPFFMSIVRSTQKVSQEFLNGVGSQLNKELVARDLKNKHTSYISGEVLVLIIVLYVYPAGLFHSYFSFRAVV